ncbi:Large-conductance mechanosensitive channel MscMJLR [uncultured archaeon]|nr:Large-conductance mechanosensitive channel MscMJLR [uncultured archaeon]
MAYESIFDGMLQSDYLWAAFWIVFAFIIAKAFSVFMKRFAYAAAKKTRLTLDDRLFPAIRRPIMYIIMVVGIYLAVMNVSALVPYHPFLVPTIYIIGIVFSALLVLRVGDSVLIWYTERRTTRQETVYTEVMPTVQKVWTMIVALVALVMALGRAGIEIGPLVTSLGIAGLAVALAFQDTLANFFAGIYLTTNRAMKKNQFIKLDTGLEGYVETVDWRNTKLKSPGGQIIIVPNVKVSQAVITNFHEPVKSYPFLVSFLVRPDADLEKIERIALEAAEKTIKSTPGADGKYPPLFRVNELNEYGVKVSVIVQADEYAQQYLIKHELLKELLKRFRKERIHLSCPRIDLVPDAQKK